MSSIGEINWQLNRINERILVAVGNLARTEYESEPENQRHIAATLEHLCRSQRALIEAQIMIFVECQESGIDMPTLPLFVEERESEPAPDEEKD